MFSMLRDNNGAREDCGANSAWRCRCLHKSYSLRHSIYMCVCRKLCGLTGRFATQDEFLPRVMTSSASSDVSDGHAHKVPASRVERAGGGDGCEDIRWDRCGRPSAVRVTRGPRSFRVHHFFPIVSLRQMEVATEYKSTSPRPRWLDPRLLSLGY